MKVDSRTATGVQGDGVCGENEAEWKDTEKDNTKQKVQALLHTHAALRKMPKRPVPPAVFCFPPNKMQIKTDRCINEKFFN